MSQRPVIVPLIHSNGDRKETLLRTLEAAYHALALAQEALQQCCPNGRNYYPVPGLLQQAEAQHRTRQEAIQGVMASLAAEAEGIDRDTRRDP